MPLNDQIANLVANTGQGRFIPDVSVEEYYSTLLKWFGIPESLMHLVLPNINAFSTRDLGFLTA